MYLNWYLCVIIISINTFFCFDFFQSRSIEASRDEKRRELEERLAREEAQKFEKLMTEGGHRKRKSRRRMSQEISPSFIQKHKLMLSVILIVGLLSIVIGVFLKRE